VPKRKDFLRNEKILNTRGDQAFYMGAENAKIESAEKSAETGGHQKASILDHRSESNWYCSYKVF
jgi:hypothetical protein